MLLSKNSLFIDESQSRNDTLTGLIVQHPNQKILGIPLKLLLHQQAKDSVGENFENWLNRKPKRRKKLENWLSKKQVHQLKQYKIDYQHWKQKNGEPPVLIDSVLIEQSKNNLITYYNNQGYFKAAVQAEVKASDSNPKMAEVIYKVEPNVRFNIDSIATEINSPVLDSIYLAHRSGSKISVNKPYKTADFENERNRLFNLFKNQGVYNFQLNSIQFEVWWDSLGYDLNVFTKLIVSDLQQNTPQGVQTIPYKIHKIKAVNIFTEERMEFRDQAYTDSIHYNNYQLFSKGPLRYRPSALTQALQIEAHQFYSDSLRTRSLQQINRLRNFQYPTINYKYADSSKSLLTANVLLTPKDRYSLEVGTDLTHSNIQDIGVAFTGTFVGRNVFRGAETIEFSTRGTIGKSAEQTISEVGADVRLQWPRFFFPFGAQKLLPQKFSPTTFLGVGTSVQRNIGLDKQRFSADLQYDWEINANKKWRFGLLEVEFVNNQNVENYFNVYRNSYNELNKIAQDLNVNSSYLNSNNQLSIPTGSLKFSEDILNGTLGIDQNSETYTNVSAIDERRRRLSQNNLIVGSSLGYTYNNRTDVFDEDFSQFRLQFEWAGNLMNLLAPTLNLKQNLQGQYEFLDVTYSQFAKAELNYIQHWMLTPNTVLALRAFGGLAIPFGNASNIPFSKSFFSGGTNDNRAWEVYRLGPGSSGSINEFNEANMKLAFNIEYRFDLVGKMKGALFTDVGNIWNVFDDIKDPARSFNGLSDLNELAIGTGFGLRYDFSFILIRLDTGFKTYNPALPKNDRWLSELKWRDAVWNIGINYPF